MISRPGLYAMVILATLASCDAAHETHKIRDELNSQKKLLEETVKKFSPEIHVENVIRGPEKETFYEFQGQRVYLKIDEKPVEDYFR